MRLLSFSSPLQIWAPFTVVWADAPFARLRTADCESVQNLIAWPGLIACEPTVVKALQNPWHCLFEAGHLCSVAATQCARWYTILMYYKLDLGDVEDYTGAALPEAFDRRSMRPRMRSA